MTEAVTWLSGQWFQWRHAVPVGAPAVMLADGRSVWFGLCGLATVERSSHWPRCPVCAANAAPVIS